MTARMWNQKLVFAISMFIPCGVAGLAWLLNNNQVDKITWRNAMASVLTSGLVGVAVGAVLIEKMSMPITLGIAVAAGLGGSTTVDLIAQLVIKRLRKMGGQNNGKDS